jgi:mRNA-degrading endonuclease RelE of RelBE toxin-antitoxin system
MKQMAAGTFKTQCLRVIKEVQATGEPGVKAGEGQWHVRWREYRLRYDIFGSEVVLHSFRHRKEAY